MNLGTPEAATLFSGMNRTTEHRRSVHRIFELSALARAIDLNAASTPARDRLSSHAGEALLLVRNGGQEWHYQVYNPNVVLA